MKIKSSIRGAVFEPRSLAAVLRSPIAIASSKGRGVKAVITEGDKRLDNSLAEKLDTKRRERATTFDIRRGRIRPCTGRATLLSLSLPLPLLLTLMARCISKEQEGNHVPADNSLWRIISTCPQDPRALSFIQLRPCLGANYIPPS